MIDDETVYEACSCHVCTTLRTVLADNLDDAPDRRRSVPLLLTNTDAAAYLGVSIGTLGDLVRDGEIRPVALKGWTRNRIPRAELDDYVQRLLTGTLRSWVEARTGLHRAGLRYMRDTKGRTYHLGDTRNVLCSTEPKGEWRTAAMVYLWDKTCTACDVVRGRLELEARERRDRKARKVPHVTPMLTVVQTADGRSVRRKGWHLGDGRTTLCGLERADDGWELPERAPRTRGCRTCQRVAGGPEGSERDLPYEPFGLPPLVT